MPQECTPISDNGILERFSRERDMYEKLARQVQSRCVELMKQDAIRHSTQWRVKSEDSLRGKIAKIRRETDAGGQPVTYNNWVSRLHDLAAVRILTYDEAGVSRAVRTIQKEFQNRDGTDDVAGEVKNRINHEEGKFYRATHLLVTLPSDIIQLPEMSNLKGVVCEIQVCSLLAHVWNEIEHDLIYKQLQGEPHQTEISLLRALGHETLAGDQIISELIEATERRRQAEVQQFQDVFDFVASVRTNFPASTRFAENAGQLFEVLAAKGMGNQELRNNYFSSESYETEANNKLSQFENSLEEYDNSILRLDPETSDILLILVLDDLAQEIIDMYPAGRGLGRPPRIASIARRYLDWKSA